MATQETVKQINSGGTLRDVEDVGARQLIADLQTALNAITSGDTTTAIKTFNEIIAFLDNIEDSSTLQGIIAGLNTSIAAKYTKPNTGIPASDLAQAVQSILNNVANKVDKEDGKGLSTNDYTNEEKTKLAGLNNYNDSALQTAISNLQTALQNVYNKSQTYNKSEVDAKVADAGKVKSVTINGTKKTPNETTGDVDLGNVVGAQGQKGDQGDTLLVDGNFDPVASIVNDTTTGGADQALSAEMGKRVAGREATDRERIDAIVAILKKATFTDDVSADIAALDELANGIDSISFNASSHKFTNLGDTFTLSVLTDPAGKTAQVIWSSSNTSVATVNNGVVTAVADGNAVITASTQDGKTATCKIVVATVVINGVSLNKQTLTLNGNDASETLIATTDPSGYEGGVQWSSSDPTKAPVDNSGKVTAVANGSTVINASIGGHSATCQVTVTGVMQTFHINVGTLTNVTVKDGQGNAITDGQSILEGSSTAITFKPSSSHEIDALSVVMGNTTLGLADATDGQNGAKVITIASVSGNIAISARASYVAKDYATDPSVVEINGYGIVSGTSGRYQANGQYKCKIIPLDFGKFYHMTNYTWQNGGTATGYNMALVKSDGNGGYTNIVNGRDVTRPYSVDQDYMMWNNNGNAFINTTNQSNQPQLNNSEVYFGVPAASEFNNVERVYLAVNTKFGNDNVSLDNFHIKELRIDTYEDINWLGYRFTGTYNHIHFTGGATPPWVMRFIPLEFGKTYNYSGYNWSDLGGANGYYSMGLIAEINGIMHLPLASEVSNYDRTFFNNGLNVIRNNAPENGTFSVPVQTDLPTGTNVVYLAVIMQGLGQTIINMSNFILTEQNT